MKKLVAAAMTTLALACTDVAKESQPSQNDSIAIVPVGPGTDPSAIDPPDTPVSEPDTAQR